MRTLLRLNLKLNVNMPRLPNRMIPAEEGVVSEG